MKIGILGGTFNPIHYGHLRAAEETLEMFSLDKIVFIPSGNPPLKTEDLADASHRYSMTKVAVTGNTSFDILDIESRGPVKSYTVNTLERLKGLFNNSDLFFILGIDAFLDISNWWMPEKLLSLADFIVVSRPSNKFSDLVHSPYLNIEKRILTKLDNGEIKSFTAELQSMKKIILAKITSICISSTDIRKCVKKGLSIKYMLPPEVESYIISNRLYLD